MISGCSATAASHWSPNYAGAYVAENLAHPQEERVKKLTKWESPRLLHTQMEPHGVPERQNAKDCLKTVKAGGKIKFRGLTDPGFVRQARVRVQGDDVAHGVGEGAADCQDFQVWAAGPGQERAGGR
eukprot:SAG11_NODE_1854_length_4165_cov_16.365224_2_plen_127_part_00